MYVWWRLAEYVLNDGTLVADDGYQKIAASRVLGYFSLSAVN